VLRRGEKVITVGGRKVETPTERFTADAVLLAAGADGFDLLVPSLGMSTGRGEKGQAALLRGTVLNEKPFLYADGLYVLPHSDGTIAIGATSERSYETPHGTDALLDDLLERAYAQIPALRQMPVIERWSGLRPRGNGRDPMLGAVPGVSGLFTVMAGFKISFGVAAKAAACVLDQVEGKELQVPPSFTVAHHIEKSG
jgi:glycine/D-amino acid oxidase-like deaminating enzyme